MRECNEGANRKKGKERRGRKRRKWKRRDEGVKKKKDRKGGKGVKGERIKEEETEEEGELRVEKERSEEEETEEVGGLRGKPQPKCSKSTTVRFFRYKCALVQILVQQRLSHSLMLCDSCAKSDNFRILTQRSTNWVTERKHFQNLHNFLLCAPLKIWVRVVQKQDMFTSSAEFKVHPRIKC